MICFTNAPGDQVFVNPDLVEYCEVKEKDYLIHVASGKFLVMPKDKVDNANAFEKLLNAKGGKG